MLSSFCCVYRRRGCRERLQRLGSELGTRLGAEVDLGEKSPESPVYVTRGQELRGGIENVDTLTAKIAAATSNSSPHEEFAERAARSSARSYAPCRYARRWPERLPDEQARRSLSNAARRPRLMVVCVLHRGLAL